MCNEWFLNLSDCFLQLHAAKKVNEAAITPGTHIEMKCSCMETEFLQARGFGWVLFNYIRLTGYRLCTANITVSLKAPSFSAQTISSVYGIHLFPK